MRILITEHQYNNLSESIDQSTIVDYINNKYRCEFHIPTGFTVFYRKQDNTKFNIPQMRDILEERFGDSYEEEIYKALLYIKENTIDNTHKKLHEAIASDRVANNIINYLNKHYYIANKFKSFYNIFKKTDDELIDGNIILQNLYDRFGTFNNLSISVVFNEWGSKKLKELKDINEQYQLQEKNFFKINKEKFKKYDNKFSNFIKEKLLTDYKFVLNMGFFLAYSNDNNDILDYREIVYLLCENYGECDRIEIVLRDIIDFLKRFKSSYNNL